MSFRVAFFLVLSALAAACSAKKAAPAEASQQALAPVEPCGLGLKIAPESTVAVIDGKKIPCSELAARGKAALLSESTEFDQRVRNLHEKNLAELISDYVLQEAADKAGLSVEKFIAASVTVEPTTIEEMHAFYDQAIAAGEKLPAFEEVQDDLINFMTEQKQMSALRDFRAGLRSQAKIDIELPILLPPAMEVEAIGPSKGPENAKVTIVEFSDFECGFCAKAEPIVEQVLAAYGDKVRLVYRDYPLPNHGRAGKAAEAAHCAGAQGKYWEMHGALFANQASLALEDLKARAAQLSLDQGAFDTCLESGQMKTKVLASLQVGSDLGVSGTPAFFINGRLVSGAQPFSRFAELIDYELSAN